MMLGSGTVLGLAIDELGVALAEVRTRSGQREIRRTGRLAFGEKLTSDNAKQLGQTLRQFLRTNHFSAKRVVVGMPASWIVTREITAPPASPDALINMLGIQAERAFSLNASELIFDYCGQTSTSRKSEVLLLAARRQVVERIRELTDAAGLQVQSVTVSVFALAKALLQTGPQPRYGLYATGTYCEFWRQLDGMPRSIQHVPIVARDGMGDDRTELLASAIQRLILLTGRPEHSGPHEVTAYGTDGLSGSVADRLNEKLSPRITVTDGCARLIADRGDALECPDGAQAVAAAAVAITAVGAEKLTVDFLNPRIGRKKTSGRQRVAVWAAIGGAVLLIAFGAVLFDWYADRADIAVYAQQLEAMRDDIAAAQEVVDRISYARSWTSQQPVFLDCLRALTQAFPEQPNVWATNVGLTENAEAVLVGKAVDDQSFYEVLDRLKQSREFSEVKMIHIRNAGRESREKEFTVTFKFQGAK